MEENLQQDDVDSKSEGSVYTPRELEGFHEIYELPSVRHASRGAEALAHNIWANRPRGKYGNKTRSSFNQLVASLETDYQWMLVWSRIKYFLTNTLSFWGRITSLIILFLLITRTLVAVLQYRLSLKQLGQTFKFKHFMMTMLCTQHFDNCHQKPAVPDLRGGH